MTDGEPKTAVSASLQKTKSIKNQHKHFFSFFILLNLKLVTVNHFDGHFAYLKTLDFFFKFSLKILLFMSSLVDYGNTWDILCAVVMGTTMSFQGD